MGNVIIICTDTSSIVLSIEKSKNILISKLHLTHKPRARQCSEGVLYVAHRKKIVISKYVLDGCGTYGIDVQTVDNILIWDCEIKNNSWLGFAIAVCNGVTLIGNKIHDNNYPGQIGDCGKVKLKHNKIFNNKKGNKIKMRHIREVLSLIFCKYILKVTQICFSCLGLSF